MIFHRTKIANYIPSTDENEISLSRKVIKEFGYNAAGFLSVLLDKWCELGKPIEFTYKKEDIERQIPSLSFFVQKQVLEKLTQNGFLTSRFGQGNQIIYTINPEQEI